MNKFHWYLNQAHQTIFIAKKLSNMTTNRTDIGNKFKDGDIPSHSDFVKIFESFVHKDEEKANFQMVETGTDNEHYITPALLRNVFQNSGIISGNCYAPKKEYHDDFTGSALSLDETPIENSVKVFKNGQLLEENEDYSVNLNNLVITFSSEIVNRNIEINYWFKNLNPSSTNSSSIFGNSSIPYKENFSGETFDDDTITLKKTPLKQSVRIYKNGQLLREDIDYSLDYENAVITFPSKISNRNIEVDYWYEGSISISEPELNSKYVDLTTNQTVAGNKTFTEAVESKSFIKTDGAPNQYLMADGSVSTSTASNYDAGHSPYSLPLISGYQKFSNGLILQWAYLLNGSTNYSFPIAWPNRACSVVLSTYRNTSGSKGFNHVYGITNTSYDAIIDGSNGYMFAIGY
jgi:hypothetical protein